MQQKKLMALLLLFPLSSTFYGCATSESKPSAPSEGQSSNSNASGKAEKKPSSEDIAKASKKISMSIGEEVGNFTITGQQEIEAPTGYNGTQYTVKTNAGKAYKCEILEPSGFGKVMTWGMASGASAMCTDFTKGSNDKGKNNKASCNALLQAAGKC